MKKFTTVLVGLLFVSILISSTYVQVVHAPIQIVGIVFVVATSWTAAYISAYALSSIYPLASDQLEKFWKLTGLRPDKYVISTDSKSDFQRLLDYIKGKLRDKVIDIIKQWLKKGWNWWSTTFRIGADASPNANPFNPRFVYRNYRLGSYVSRWDFYPPGSWTINQWIVDINGDGRTDFIVDRSVYGFYLK